MTKGKGENYAQKNLIDDTVQYHVYTWYDVGTCEVTMSKYDDDTTFSEFPPGITEPMPVDSLHFRSHHSLWSIRSKDSGYWVLPTGTTEESMDVFVASLAKELSTEFDVYENGSWRKKIGPLT